VYLVGFTIRIYVDARSPERQKTKGGKAREKYNQEKKGGLKIRSKVCV
jgi:hypothetical protein